jgi:hypothetical protein
MKGDSIIVLRCLIITDSFLEQNGPSLDSELLLWARMSNFKHCRVYFTETKDLKVEQLLRRYNCKVGGYEYENGIIIYSTQKSKQSCGHIDEASIEKIMLLSQLERDALSSINFNGDYVIIKNISSRKSDFWEQISKSRKIVDSEKAIEYLRVNLVQNSLYDAYIDGERRVSGSEWLYLTYRLRTVFPEYQTAWEAVSALDSLNSRGVDILSSLGQRLEFLLKTVDSLLYYSNIDNGHSNLVNLNYYFTYFILLSTGCFDAVAWLCDLIYEINTKNKNHVTLKRPQRESNPGFIASIGKVNINLGEILKKDETQAMLAVFYPFRDSFMHREILQTVTIGGYDGESALILSAEMLTAVKGMPEYDEDSWGIEFNDHVILSKFIPKITAHFIMLYNQLLQAIDWKSLLEKEPQLTHEKVLSIIQRNRKDFWRNYHFSEKPLFW